MKTISVSRFDRGMVNDPNTPVDGVCRVCTNFDGVTNAYRITPYHSTEDGDSSSSTQQIKNFCIGLWSATGVYRIFGLGVVSGTARAEIYMKDLTTGGTNDLSDSTWATPSNNTSSSGTSSTLLFVYYALTGKIYGARAGSAIWAFTPDGSTVWADTSQSLSYTNIAQGLVHSKDDILYIPYDNKIAKNNNGSWTTTALTLPSRLYITSIAERGNYLVIACAPLSGVGESVVYLWDRDSSLTTLSESIYWGEGKLQVIGDIDGTLVGVSLYGGNSTRLQSRIVFKYWDSFMAKTFLIIETTSTTGAVLNIAKQIIDGRLLFQMTAAINGATREGIFSIGKNKDGNLALYHEQTPNNDTATVNGVLHGFFKVGDFFFQSYTTNNAVAMSKTVSNTNTYSATSIYETVVCPNMSEADRPQLKQLISAALQYESLPANGQAVMKYRLDGASSWTTLFTETTDGVVYTEPVTANAAGGQFGQFHDVEFRIESTGGAIPIGYTYKYNVIPSNA